MAGGRLLEMFTDPAGPLAEQAPAGTSLFVVVLSDEVVSKRAIPLQTKPRKWTLQKTNSPLNQPQKGDPSKKRQAETNIPL